MPTAVVELELTTMPDEVVVDHHYHQAFVVIRLNHQVVGTAWLPVSAGRVQTPDLRRSLLDAAGWPACQVWLNTRSPNPQTGPSPAEVTVVVCTRDRPDDLANCLAALHRLPAAGQQLLVVDNASRDAATRQVVAQWPTVRYVYEPQPGLAAARNRAVAEATTPLIAFTDDDAQPDPGWLAAALPHFADPFVGCVTGLTLPIELETEAQELFEWYSSFSRGFELRHFKLTNHNPFVAHAPGSGNNMLVRRSTIQQIGGYHERFGASGSAYLPAQWRFFGEDTLSFSCFWLAGYCVVYEPQALIWHRHRRDMAGLLRQIRGYHVGFAARQLHWLLAHGELGGMWLFARTLAYYLSQLWRGMRRQPQAWPVALTREALLGLCTGPIAYLRANGRVPPAQRG